MDTQFVIPRSDFKIYDPARKDFLPADGRLVPDDLYWAALIRDGDVTVGTAPPDEPPAKKGK